MQRKKVVRRRKKLDPGMAALAAVADKPRVRKKAASVTKKRVRRKKKVPDEPIVVDCEVCGSKGVALAFVDADREWEFKGHQDHHQRNVGSCCLDWLTGRDILIQQVLNRVCAKLVKKAGGNEHGVLTSGGKAMIIVKLDQLGKKLSSDDVTPGGPEDRELIKWATKLKLEGPWIEAATK